MNIASIELHHMRNFVAIVEHRSFRAAALHLHISPPPLTRQIHQLEEALGVRLLVRKPRGIELTDAGKVFFQEAKNILSLTKIGADRTQRAGHGQSGRLDIGVFGSAMFNAIPRIVRRFRESYPSVEIVMHNLDRDSQIKALRERRIDLGFNRLFADESDLVWEVIQTERLHVTVHDRHPLANRSMIGLSDIADQQLILYPNSSRPSFIDYIMEQFYRLELSPTFVREVDDVVTAISVVSSGFGITMVTDSACSIRMPGIIHIPTLPQDKASLDLCVIHRKDDESKLVSSFLKVARAFRNGPEAPPIIRVKRK